MKGFLVFAVSELSDEVVLMVEDGRVFVAGVVRRTVIP